MTYAVKEMFYTIQGEGFHAGRAAVFIRFAGCNLWSGREVHRDRDAELGGCSRWCDTDFVGTSGEGGGRFGAQAIAERASAMCPSRDRFVVLTGGEPALQVDAPLVEALHGRGFEITIETNGTVDLLHGIDWVCVSPKGAAALRMTTGDELKLVHPQPGIDPSTFASLAFKRFSLQPMDGPRLRENTAACTEYVKAHPQWRLSIQVHKMIGIP